MAQTKTTLNEEAVKNTGTPEAKSGATQNSEVSTTVKRPGTGLEFRRQFSDGRISPFDAVVWERRTALIGNEKGQVIFRQENVEVPKAWSQTATNIVASKYFHG